MDLLRATAVLLVVLLGLVQYRLWAGTESLAEVWRLRQAVMVQAEETGGLEARNEPLAAELDDLKTGLAAVEDRARRELGLIGRGETFYQVVER